MHEFMRRAATLFCFRESAAARNVWQEKRKNANRSLMVHLKQTPMSDKEMLKRCHYWRLRSKKRII